LNRVPATTGWLPAKPLLILILGLVLTGCGGSDDPSAPDRATEAASPAAEVSSGGGGNQATPPSPTIGEIVWATEIEPESNRPVAQVDRFTSDTTTIFALLPITGVPAGTVVRAAWSYNGTALDTLAASTTVDVTSDEMVWIEFHLSRDREAPWPDGTYVISIAIGDAARRDASVEVVDPE
jgi:hypothetical protein